MMVGALGLSVGRRDRTRCCRRIAGIIVIRSGPVEQWEELQVKQWEDWARLVTRWRSFVHAARLGR
jgi:hypothetical protein